MAKQYVFFFGDSKADGNASQKNLLGGKGANLAEMVNLGIPVPPGFTISTEVCTHFYDNEQSYPESLAAEIDTNISKLEKTSGKKFGDAKDPLLVSVRSGAPISMPGMMDTVLNLGLCDATLPGIIEKTSNERFAYDSYRRFIQMFGNVVMGIDGEHFEKILEQVKEKVGVKIDTELSAKDLQEVVALYKEEFKKQTGEELPQDPRKQLQKAIDAVFLSWNNQRAITYRKLHDISSSLGTAVNVQSMVFGNMGDDCGTGVAFTRNPSNGEKKFFGEFLMNAQGEDVVAGIRTPLSIEKMGEILPNAYKELLTIAERLENHYKDMQDLEFTIEQKKLYLLQTRNGKRTSFASVRIAVELVEEKLIDEKTAIERVDPSSLSALLANIFDSAEKKKVADKVMTKGLAAGPGAASGKISLAAEKAVETAKSGEPTILVRVETSPEDIAGMHHAKGILTSRGGMTSHAAVVARGMNKPCVVGCSDLQIDYEKKTVSVSSGGQTITLHEGDNISIDGFTGEVINAEIKTIPSEIEQVYIQKNLKLEDSLLARQYSKLLEWANKNARLTVRANADTGHDAAVARLYGAQGIGLCRTEHMFFHEERILAMREMIVAQSVEEREKALDKILPFQRNDFKDIFKAMDGLPVTVRLLDPPLHEFLPHTDEAIAELAKSLNKEPAYIRQIADELHEFNPMLGHRGCRLGIAYPEITRMQTRAILEAAAELTKEGVVVKPEIMVPLVGHYKELEHQAKVIRETAKKVEAEKGMSIPFMLGTMIEVPRAALTADEIAKHAEFFSFGTNDLTQMGAGFSRDDSGAYLPLYADLGIYDKSPFEVLDRDGIGQLIEIAVTKAKKVRPDIKLGVCGEHGGDPASIEFCHEVGLNYVSCSPYRVPVARLAAAKSAL